MKVITITNYLKQSGKTITTVNLGYELSRCGRRVLIIDMDCNSDATTHLGIYLEGRPSREIITFSDCFRGSKNPNDFILHARQNLDILFLTEYEPFRLKDVPEREYLLRRQVIPSFTGKYDYIFLDTLSCLGFVEMNAFLACDRVYLLLPTHSQTIRGIERFVTVITEIHDYLNPQLRLGGVIFTMLSKPGCTQAVMDLNWLDLCESHAVCILIPRSPAIAIAQSLGLTVNEYRPEDTASRAFQDIAADLMLREEPGLGY